MPFGAGSRLALLRAGYASLSAAARAAVAAAAAGDPDPLAYVRAELVRHGGLPPAGAAVPQVLADASAVMRMIDQAAGGVTLTAAEADTAWQALADAAAWHAEHGGCAHCPALDQHDGHERHAAIVASYAALRTRLGG